MSLLKVSTFSAYNTHGEVTAVPLFGPADGYFEKTASVSLLPPVMQYIENLQPRNDAQYVLVNALGASEFFGSNVNGDGFEEEALIHKPDHWADNPLVDRVLAKDWTYGFPTFYNAHPFCFPAGSVVTMADRTRRPIDEIEVGDRVATKAGPREVASVNVRDYDGEGIRLTLRGVSDELVATADHPVLVYRRAQVHCRHKYSKLNQPVPGSECVECHDPEWVPIEEVDVGDYMILPPAKHGNEGVPREFAELLGWVASEGHLGKRGLIQFSFSENNVDDVASVARCLEENGLHVTHTPRPQYGLVMLSACSAELSGKLAEYITGVLSEKRFTERVLELDEAALCALLGAYIDGAGHICSAGKNKGQLRIRSSSPGMLDILGDILRSIGVEAAVNRDRDPGQPIVSPTNGKVYYDNGSGCVAVSASWLPELLSKVRTRKQVEAAPGKSRKYGRVNGDVLVQVTHREEIHLTEKVYCLSVPGPEHYLVSDVVVHNSHHRNQDPSRAFGSVELVAWNDHMKRVELVARVDRDKCQKYGGVGTWDKLKAGKFADTSMGAKVPYDLSSITTDWKLIEEARATFDPKKHKHRGMAVLAFHEKLKKKDNRGIPGLAVTRKDYDIWCRTKMNQILGDGRKVYVHNPEPRFFDISFVFIGADRTSKVMAFIWRDGWPVQVKPSALVAEELGAQESTALVDGVKAAAATDHKAASIVKEVPSNLASAVVGKMTKVEPDLSKSMLSAMSALPLDSVLSTTAGMGIVLKPREFQRVVLVRMGRSGDADALDTLGSVLPSIDDKNDIDALGFEPSLDQGALSPSLAKLLSGMLPERSAFAPFAEDRAIICIVKKPKESTPPVSASLIPELLNRIGAAYSGYRRRLMQATEDMKTLMEHLKDSSPSLAKTAADDVTLFTPLSLRYLETAYMDERA